MNKNELVNAISQPMVNHNAPSILLKNVSNNTATAFNYSLVETQRAVYNAKFIKRFST